MVIGLGTDPGMASSYINTVISYTTWINRGFPDKRPQVPLPPVRSTSFLPRMPLELPDDLIFEIVGHLSKDQDALCMLSLVARRLLPVCQSRLFREIDLLFAMDGHTTQQDIDRKIERYRKLCIVLSSNPDLGRLTRVLRVSLFERYRLELRGAESLLAELLRWFQGIRAFTLDGQGPNGSSYLENHTGETISAIGNILRTPTLRHLTLKNINAFPRRVLYHCLDLDSVDFERVNFKDLLRDNLDLPLNATTQSWLSRLRIAGHSVQLKDFEDHRDQWNLSTLRELHIDVLRPWSTRDAIGMIARFDRELYTLQSLTHLYWGVPDFRCLSPGMFQDLQLPPSAHSFTLDIVKVSKDTIPESSRTILRDIFDDVKQPCPIKNLAVQVADSWMGIYTTNEGEDCLRALDRTLSSQFQSVEWIIEHSDSDSIPIQIDWERLMPILYGDKRLKIARYCCGDS